MKQKLAIILALLLATTLMQAQVTIGSNKSPVAGALLMLDDGTKGPNRENAMKGLGLPCVELQDYNSLQMGATPNAELVGKETEHIGLVVYNINTDFDKCKATSIPSGMYIWEGTEWTGVSISDDKAFIPSPEHTPPLYQPNTYMVTTVGKASSVTIPVAKAFAVWEYWASAEGGKKLVPTPFTGSLSVEMEWEEAFGDNSNDIIGTPTLNTTNLDKTATITVPTTGNPGNALVTLSDGYGIRWSWHIWVTNEPATTEFNDYIWMDRNLGATSAFPGDDSTLGLQYQWGRHTPITGYIKLGDPFHNRSTVTFKDKNVIDVQVDDGNTPATQNTLAYAISNPRAFITGFRGTGGGQNNFDLDWYAADDAGHSYMWNDRWMGENVMDLECPDIIATMASITNPCPLGWKVPVGSSSKPDFPWDGLTLENGGEWNHGWTWQTPHSAGYYPAAGSRKSGQAAEEGGQIGRYWGAAPLKYAVPTSNYLLFSEQYFMQDAHTRWLSYPVRCVKVGTGL